MVVSTPTTLIVSCTADAGFAASTPNTIAANSATDSLMKPDGLALLWVFIVTLPRCLANTQ